MLLNPFCTTALESGVESAIPCGLRPYHRVTMGLSAQDVVALAVGLLIFLAIAKRVSSHKRRLPPGLLRSPFSEMCLISKSMLVGPLHLHTHTPRSYLQSPHLRRDGEGIKNPLDELVLSGIEYVTLNRTEMDTKKKLPRSVHRTYS
jgi:hypothetical protein